MLRQRPTRPARVFQQTQQNIEFNSFTVSNQPLSDMCPATHWTFFSFIMAAITTMLIMALLTAHSIHLLWDYKSLHNCIAVIAFLTFHLWSCYTCQQLTTAPWDPAPSIWPVLFNESLTHMNSLVRSNSSTQKENYWQTVFCMNCMS